MGAIIWQKMTTSNTSGGAFIMGSYPYPRNGILKIDYEFILLFKKPGKPKKKDKEIKEKSKMTSKEWNTYFSGHWNFSGEKQKDHLAMFPLELPNRLIKMFSFVGDTVLDPFLGSGTTALSASNLNRNSVGYEINNDFLSIIKDKLSDVSNIEFIKKNRTKSNFKKDIHILPYIFTDTVNIDKKVDPRKNQYGSKIDQNANGDTTDYYSVKEIHSPNILTLSNGMTIKLIGVNPIKGKASEAKQFIAEKTKGQKVFLKYDTIEFDNQKNRLSYLYLNNKTFINAHLIKNGLAKTDNGFDYKHYKRFLKYEEVAP
jgi:site-specific DNA-methyltransferase (adenine-specific)